MIVVGDTSPISNLIVVGQIQLLPQLFSSVVIPEAVFQELLANGVEHPVTQTVQISRSQISPPASKNL